MVSVVLIKALVIPQSDGIIVTKLQWKQKPFLQIDKIGFARNYSGGKGFRYGIINE